MSNDAPTPSTGPEGSDLHSIAGQIEGLLDDDGHFNPTPDTVSRAHPDYDASEDSREPARDERGRFTARNEETAGGDEAADSDEAAEEISAADGDDRDADTSESDTDADLTATADDEAEASDEETVTIDSLGKLADELGISLSDLKEQLSHTFRAADEDITVTLSELEKGYQKDADYRRSTAKLAEDRRAFEAQTTANMQRLQTEHTDLATSLNAVEQIISADLNNADMEQLRRDHPAEWTARREEIGQKLSTLRGIRQQAAARYDQLLHEHRAQVREREMGMLKEAVPDFSNDHRNTAKEAISSLGYTDAEIAELMDHRLIKGALELANLRNEVKELRELKTKAAETVKRVKKDVPTLQKPGKAKANAGARVQRDKLASLRDRARKSGKVEDAALVIEQFL